jgi:ABC-2 type transport system permease protein
MTMTSVAEAPAGAVGRRALVRLTATEGKLFIRERVGPVWGLGFPLVLLIIFGSIHSFHTVRATYGGLTLLDVYLPILIEMMLALLALVAMPLVLAGYRERGILRRLRTTPAGPLRVLAAQILVNFACAVVATLVLVLVARFAYGVSVPRQFGGFVVAALLVAVAMLCIGLFVAAVGKTGRIAQIIGAILFYPLIFFAGLWLPIPSMPAVLQHISHATPLGAAWESFQNAELGRFPGALPLLTIVAWAVVFGLAAWRLFRWE